MLVLSRAKHEAVTIDTPAGEIRVAVTHISGRRAWLGIEAPAAYRIHRGERQRYDRAEGEEQ